MATSQWIPGRIRNVRFAVTIGTALASPRRSGLGNNRLFLDTRARCATLNSVVNAWRARQDRTRSARFTWHETRTIAGDMPLERRPIAELKRLGNPPEKTFEYDCSLSLDGDMLRWEAQERNGCAS